MATPHPSSEIHTGAGDRRTAGGHGLPLGGFLAAWGPRVSLSGLLPAGVESQSEPWSQRQAAWRPLVHEAARSWEATLLCLRDGGGWEGGGRGPSPLQWRQSWQRSLAGGRPLPPQDGAQGHILDLCLHPGTWAPRGPRMGPPPPLLSAEESGVLGGCGGWAGRLSWTGKGAGGGAEPDTEPWGQGRGGRPGPMGGSGGRGEPPCG